MAIDKNVLLVEGPDEVRTIPYLMGLNGIDWGRDKNTIVKLRNCEGYANIIKASAIAVELKADGIEALGILLDADEFPQNRWIAIRNACRNSKMISNIPDDIPVKGLIIQADNGVRVGIWIMPDNKLPGMLETFLGYLIPTGTSSLWEFAESTINTAKTLGAPFSEAHRDKAQIYSWLAWQKPPGLQIHQAIKERILDPQHPEAQMFVNWFRELYQL
jgi:hypothetical protein